MAAHHQTYQAILQEAARGGERSTLFWFLVERHDELVAQAAGKRLRWDALCRRFAEHGLTDRRGLPATPETARKTWLRARRVVAEARDKKRAAEAQRGPGDTYPSRMSPDWRPQVPPPPIPPAPASAASTGVALYRRYGLKRDPDMPPEAQAGMDRVLADLAASDERKFGF